MTFSRLAGIAAAAAASFALIATSSVFPHQSSPETTREAKPPAPPAGLQKPWPNMVVPVDNPTTPEKVALGRLLFYDSVLSNNNSISCAHCHHPDLGFSDGLPRAIGYGGEGVGPKREGGVVLPRRTPTLWNSGYSHRQYWDGRAKDLEEQCRIPIIDRNEMKQDEDTLVAELLQIPEYVARFDKVFGGRAGSGVAMTNVTRAIATFERTLVSRNSRFDRYAAGEMSALTSSETRGLKLFLSRRTRCSECHGLPTFANPAFAVTGVGDVRGLTPDPKKEDAEPGRGGGANGAYKIPTLRNVALKPPYMHNGSLKTLSDVVDFYSGGGGRGRGLNVPRQDHRVRGFPVSKQEKTDLVAFLKSLTDVSSLPPVPKAVPSGLDVVPRL